MATSKTAKKKSVKKKENTTDSTVLRHNRSQPHNSICLSTNYLRDNPWG